MARLGPAGPGAARPGEALQGEDTNEQHTGGCKSRPLGWRGQALPGRVGCGAARLRGALHGLAWRGRARLGRARHGAAKQGKDEKHA